MKARIIDETFHFGEVVEANVVYYDIHHTGDGPDLCHVKINGQSFDMLSSQLEIIKQPEPEDKFAGYNNATGQPVYGGNRLVRGQTIYDVVWDGKLGEWKLERVEGSYSYPTLPQVRRMYPANNARLGKRGRDLQ